MELVTLLAEARSAGLTVAAEGDRVIVRGPKAAERFALELLGHKTEVLSLLAGESIALPSPNVCPRCFRSEPSVTSTGREGRNGSHPGELRAFRCETDDGHAWLVYENGVVLS